MNYPRMIRYFRPQSPAAGIIILIIGVFVLLGGSGGLSSRNGATAGIIMMLVGAGLIAAGILMLIQMRRNKVTDAEVDAAIGVGVTEVITKDKILIASRGVEATDVPPLTLYSFVWEGATYKRRGQDGLWRSNLIEVLYAVFGPDSIHAATDTFSITGPEPKTSTTHEVFYRDVVSVEIGTLSHRGGQGQVFSITTSGGTSIACGVVATPENVAAVEAARALIMNRKRESL